ncbi:serine/arginine-rich splicing factor 1A-like [Amphiura filiformis]|uniref:serine/arginine-rich splicing factor 1A-like n=1 Tax=Amphiura filiformis TaxID=82378 RepID=UPI003B212CDA
MSYRERDRGEVLRGPAGNNDRRIYVGNLPDDVRERDVKDLFYKYGDILDVDLKANRTYGSPFAFIEFKDRLDAEDAVYKRDGYSFDGCKLRVEFPRGGGRRGGGGGGGGYDRGYDRGGGYGRGRGRGPPTRSNYKIFVSGLPPTGSWQDLKDHMREAGEVCYADVDKNGEGTGVVEFLHRDDMKYAVKNLNDTKFKSHEGESAYIRVTADRNTPSRSRSRSSSPARRERSYTRSRSLPGIRA